MMKLSCLVIPALFATSTGCASIVSHSTWPVNVTATPADAEVEIVNESGVVVHKAKAPFTVELKSGRDYFDGEKYTLKASAPGFTDGSLVLDSKVNGWYWGNFIFAGLIGFLIVDPMTGAMYTLPDTAHVELSPIKT
jgi:hypothetical protein